MLRVGKIFGLVLGLLIATQCFSLNNYCSNLNNPVSPPLYPQCPAIGCNTGCAYLIVVADTGVTVLNDASQGPYEGHDDMLIGVQNNTTNSTIYSINLSGSEMNDGALKGIFNLSDSDIHTSTPSDGICGYWPGTNIHISPAPPTTNGQSCPFGPTLYEGPNTSFSNIDDATNSGVPDSSGTVNFTNGLPPGSSAYFSLEDAPTDASLITVTPSYNLTASALSPSSLTAGQSATTMVTLTPILPGISNGVATTTQNVQLGCSITPTPPTGTVTCNFSPATAAISNGPGSPAVSSTLTVATVQGAAGSTVRNDWQLPLALFFTIGLGMLSLLAYKIVPRRRPALAVMGCLMLVAAVFLASCGRGKSSSSTSGAATYSITVTGTPAQANAANPLSLTVNP